MHYLTGEDGWINQIHSQEPILHSGVVPNQSCGIPVSVRSGSQVYRYHFDVYMVKEPQNLGFAIDHVVQFEY